MRKDDERLAAPTPGGDAFAGEPAEIRPLHGILFVLVGGFLYLVGRYLIAAFLVLVGVLTAWVVGLVLAVKLARRRAVLPKGLWVAAVVLTGLYLLLLAVLVAACFW